jgi:hypothetical protein
MFVIPRMVAPGEDARGRDVPPRGRASRPEICRREKTSRSPAVGAVGELNQRFADL